MTSLDDVQFSDSLVWQTIPNHSLDYWLFLIESQLAEIRTRPEHASQEMADIWFIVLHYLRLVEGDAYVGTVLRDRLLNRHMGKTSQIEEKYVELYRISGVR